MGYAQTDVFVVCFSVTDPSSFSNVTEQWLRELKDYSPAIPIVLMGTKIDLREDEQIVKQLDRKNQVVITREMGEQLAEEIGAKGYVECSALKNEGLEESIKEIVAAGANYALKLRDKRPQPSSASSTPKRCILC